MSQFSKEQQALMARGVINDCLRRIEDTYHRTGGLDMDAYHGIQKSADVLARLAGYNSPYRPSYPNPCSEILMRHTRPDND